MKTDIEFLAEALQSLRPGVGYVIIGTNYSDTDWNGYDNIPTQQEVDNEINRFKTEYQSTEYQRLRANEYPNFIEYLDGIVKGDQTQIQAYIDACITIKEKYPKP